MRKYLFLALALMVSMSLFAQDETTENTETNTKLPSVKLKDLDGKEVDLATYAENGKITIISIWATWCAPCIKEITNVNEILDDWIDDYDVEFVAISIDDSRNSVKVKPYANGKGWEFDVLLDVNGDTKRALNYTNPPFTVLVDQNGNIVYKHTGYVEGDEYHLEEEIEKIAE